MGLGFPALTQRRGLHRCLVATLGGGSVPVDVLGRDLLVRAGVRGRPGPG